MTGSGAAGHEQRGVRAARDALWLLVGCAGIVTVQVLVLAAGNSAFFSGSDAGGRAAAVAAAAPGCDHDLGYWAAAWDPDGRVHPMVNTERIGDRFVQPASTVYVCAAGPIAGAFGIPAAALLSIAGVLLAALGARALERLGGADGVLSFVLVGVVGPVAFYGTDVWEHAPATGLAVSGTALVLTLRSPAGALVGGVAWGLAIALRSETLLVAAGLLVAVLVVAQVRVQFLGQVGRSMLVAVGAAGAVVVDRLLERWLLGGDYRTGRAGSQVGGAFEAWQARGRDALTTTLGLLPSADIGPGVVLGAVFVVGLSLTGAVVAGLLPDTRPVRCAIAIAAVALLPALVDPGFVPGMFVAAPMAVVGMFAVSARVAAPPIARVLAVGAMAALPAIWALQWTGNLVAQWGGRYLLSSGALLTVSGAMLAGRRARSTVAASAVVLSVAVGVMGLIWHVERTHRIAGLLEDVAALPCDGVLISAQPFLLREGGALPELRTGVRADGCRMLSAAPEDVPYAVEVARRAGEVDVAVLGRGVVDGVPEPLAAFDVVSRDVTELGGVAHTVYRLDLR